MITTGFNLSQWFSERGLKALEYQQDIISNKIPESLRANQLPTVLAACPSAGKTIMSIAFIEKYLTENPSARVLVLTHGTTVLRSQYYEELEIQKPKFTFSHIQSKADSINNTSQVWVALPHTLKSAKLPKFHLLIVDEAHHFYFAEMVKAIIGKAKPDHQVLLTGTPSPFIKNKFPIIPVTVNQLLDCDMIEDVMVELASSTYSFGKGDYNGDYELKTSVRIRERETTDTLDKLLDEVLFRVRSYLKNKPKGYTVTKIFGVNSWKRVLDTLQKTMIACKSQEQAKQVEKYLEAKGIKTALSISDTDVDSIEIERFKKENKCLVLIVVRRGVLGFNMPELENVIDMTTSQNIDWIFQLMSRVLRKHPDGKKKFFFKVVPHTMADYYEHVMTAALCLTDERYYLTYNGKNFLDMEIPVVREKVKRPRKNASNPAKTKPDGATKKKSSIQTLDYHGLPSIRFFKDLLHKNHALLSSYAYVTISEVRNALLFQRESISVEQIWASAKGIEL